MAAVLGSETRSNIAAVLGSETRSNMAAVLGSETRSHLLGCGLIKVGHDDVGAFLGQPRGTGPADTVRSTGDDHRSAGESPKVSLPHSWSLPPARIKGSHVDPDLGRQGWPGHGLRPPVWMDAYEL